MALTAALLVAATVQSNGSELRRSSFGEIAGWAADDHRAAFRVFRSGCAKSPARKMPRILGTSASLVNACRAATALEPAPSQEVAKAFFERWFIPHEVKDGFLTAYFEPEISGSTAPDAAHSAPALSWPTGDTASLPERSAIEQGALAGRSKALLYLDPVDLFVTQVQGSARIRLTDGSRVRLAYAGRNGKPYTAIGKVLVDRGVMALEEVTMDRIVAWLRANPGPGRDLIRENKSYVFFKINTALAADAGPIGGAGLSLTAGRSLAVDHKIWPYGLPIWIGADLPNGAVQRLTVAQDTGTAIVGQGRADLFLGTGPEAGSRAGDVRHPMTMVVLLPRERALP